MNKCPECDNEVYQCDVSGDYMCTICDWWADADDVEEDDED